MDKKKCDKCGMIMCTDNSMTIKFYKNAWVGSEEWDLCKKRWKEFKIKFKEYASGEK